MLLQRNEIKLLNNSICISVEFEIGRYRRIAAITYCEVEVEPLEREKILILIRDGFK